MSQSTTPTKQPISVPELGQEILREFLARPRPQPNTRFIDEHSRPLPMTEAQQKAHAAEVITAIATIAMLTDESDNRVDWEEAERELDSFRSHRPLFSQD